MFLPATSKELKNLGWDRPDIILITGDAYIDSPHIGVAVIGRVLSDAGYKVAVIAQPDLKSGADIARLGEPRLFWGITGGCMDSLIANYTAAKKKKAWRRFNARRKKQPPSGPRGNCLRQSDPPIF